MGYLKIRIIPPTKPQWEKLIARERLEYLIVGRSPVDANVPSRLFVRRTCIPISTDARFRSFERPLPQNTPKT